MSQVKIQGNASGTGIFTVAAPATNTDRTLTLPDQTGTVLTNAGPYTANASASNGAVTIDASNNVGIGTSSPVGRLNVYGSNVYMYLYNTAGTSNDSHTATIQSYNPSAYWNKLALDGSQLIFNTYTTERARIDSSGNLLVNTTGTIGSASGVLQVKGKSSENAMQVQIGTNGNNGILWYNAAGSAIGSIVVNSASVAYNTSSDYRLKENIQPMAGALARVALLKPCTYTWKSDSSAGEGFIAHELQEVCPDAVSGEKDAVNEDGSIKPQGIDTSFLVATLTAAIKEQQAIIESLTARIAALEAA